MRTKYIHLIIAIAILISAYVFTYFYMTIVPHMDHNDVLEIDYSISVVPDQSNTSFEINLPVPLWTRNNIVCHEVVEALDVVDGEGDLAVSNSQFGASLTLSGNGSLSVKASVTIKHDQYDNSLILSLCRDGDEQNRSSSSGWYWVFCNCSGVKVALHLESKVGSTMNTFDLFFTPLEAGWQPIAVKKWTQVA